MGAAMWLIRRQLRRRWPALVPLALLVAVGAGGALIAIGAAQRTSNAYARYLDDADVGDLVINPSLNTTDIADVIRNLPGVRGVTHDTLFLANPGDDGHRRTRAEFDAGVVTGLVRGSPDGRYTAMDRPAISQGRLPTGADEAFVTGDVADAENVEVGDVLTISFWQSRDDVLAEPDDMVEPVGVEDLTVVGIGTLPGEVLPEELYNRGQILVSPEVADRYDCLGEMPSQDVSVEQLVEAIIPPQCSTSYSYYSLEIDGGEAGTAAALDAYLARAGELNQQLPPALEEEFGYILISTSTADEEARVARSVRPSVTALVLLGLGAAAVALALFGLAVTRELRRSERDQLQWSQLGMTGAARVAVVAVPQVVAAGLGFVVAVVGAWLLSPVGPVGAVRVVDPSPSRQLAGWAVLAALALAAVGIAGTVLLSVRSARRLGRTPSRRLHPSVVRRAVSGAVRPDVGEGLRAAYGGNRGAGVVVATGAVAAGALLAAVVFGSSLSALVSTPSSYGWPWDAAVMTGYGYGNQDVDAIVSTLDGSDDVERWTGLGFGTATVDGEPATAMLGFGPPSELDLTVVEGRLPTSAGEVALGRKTAEAIDAGVGDEIEFAADLVEPGTVIVTGIVVLPALGPFQSDRAAPGAGVLVPSAMLDDELLDAYLSFVGMDLVDGADPAAVLGDLGDGIATWTLEPDTPAVPLVEPVRPPEIVNADSLQAAPLLVGGLLAVAGAVGLYFAVVVSVRARRLEFGTLRALGFTGRQLRNSVRVQAVATTVAALVVGAPLGVAVGRLAWRAFATDLGVASEPSIPMVWIAATIVGGLVVAVTAAAVPARAAARAAAADILRAE